MKLKCLSEMLAYLLLFFVLLLIIIILNLSVQMYKDNYL